MATASSSASALSPALPLSAPCCSVPVISDCLVDDAAHQPIADETSELPGCIFALTAQRDRMTSQHWLSVEMESPIRILVAEPTRAGMARAIAQALYSMAEQLDWAAAELLIHESDPADPA